MIIMIFQYDKLNIQEGSKCNLPGVWDPAPEDDKYILIKYLYQNSVHQVLNTVYHSTIEPVKLIW